MLLLDKIFLEINVQYLKFYEALHDSLVKILGDNRY